MTSLEILKAARKLISDEKCWTQGAYARECARRCSPCSCRRCCVLVCRRCFCQGGSRFRKCDIAGITYTNEMSEAALLLPGHGLMWVWNDAPERTHAEILQRFDEAIARLEAGLS